MKYKIKAISVNPLTGDKVAGPLEEIIDTETNELFQGRLGAGPWFVEDIYHDFWNRLNPSWETAFPANKEKIVVLSVTSIDTGKEM